MYINHISPSLDKPSRIILVQTLVLSIINYYCLRIWGTTNITITNDVQKLKNFAARVAIGGIRKYDHIAPALKELGWLKVNEKHLFDTCSLVYKVINKFYPPWLKCYMTVREVTGNTTRQHNDLHVPETRTDSGIRSVDVMGPIAWNNLPSDITNAGSYHVFKNLLTSHILSKRPVQC